MFKKGDLVVCLLGRDKSTVNSKFDLLPSFMYTVARDQPDKDTINLLDVPLGPNEGYCAYRFELYKTSATMSQTQTTKPQQRDLTGVLFTNASGDVWEVQRRDSVRGSWEVMCVKAVGGTWAVGATAYESTDYILANEVTKAAMLQSGAALSLKSDHQPQSVPHAEVPNAVVACHCGKQKVWYQPFRGERELVCPTCPSKS